jgi:hypothetical protein
MALSREVLDGLVELVMGCTARVTALDGGFPAGAAFFVDGDLLITNRHVVGDPVEGQEQKVLVSPFGGQPRQATVLAPSERDADLDIALVRCPPQAGDPPRTAVLLHRDMPRAESGYQLVGYPREDFYTDLGAGLEAPDAHANPRLDNVTKRPQLLRMRDIQIKKGFSGGPVLSWETGAIAAVAVYTESEDAALGGGAIPVDRAADAYEELRLLVSEPPAAANRWRELLGRAHWESLGLVWDPGSQVDVYLSGDRSCWRIARRSGEDGSPFTVRDLGDEMGEVLARWARSSGRRDESEVKLLGHLLSAALFPASTADHLPEPAPHNREPVLFRLHVDPSGPLAELPWELVTVPQDPDRFLAAQEGYAFARVDDIPSASGEAPGTQANRRPRVLGVVVRPSELTLQPPRYVGGKSVPWPEAGDIESELSRAINNPGRFDVTVETNPHIGVLDSLTSDSQFDIVHYVGFGYEDEHRSYLALADSSGRQIQWMLADKLLGAFARTQPRLLVLELGLPPFEQRQEPLGPGILAAARNAGAPAVVSTRPLHPLQHSGFNWTFYDALGRGRSVEHAVQLGRDSALSSLSDDFASFGWFMLATGRAPRSRVVEPATEDTLGEPAYDDRRRRSFATDMGDQARTSDDFRGP